MHQVCATHPACLPTLHPPHLWEKSLQGALQAAAHAGQLWGQRLAAGGAALLALVHGPLPEAVGAKVVATGAHNRVLQSKRGRNEDRWRLLWVESPPPALLVWRGMLCADAMRMDGKYTRYV
jgi:hypothetical protein